MTEEIPPGQDTELKVVQNSEPEPKEIKCPICGTKNEPDAGECKMCRTSLTPTEEGKINITMPRVPGDIITMVDIEDPGTRKTLEELALIPGVSRIKAIYLYQSGITSIEEYVEKAFHGERRSDNFTRMVTNKILMSSVKGKEKKETVPCPSCKAPNSPNSKKCKVCGFEIALEMATLNMEEVEKKLSCTAEEVFGELLDSKSFSALPEDLKAQVALILDSDDFEDVDVMPEAFKRLGVDSETLEIGELPPALEQEPEKEPEEPKKHEKLGKEPEGVEKSEEPEEKKGPKPEKKPKKAELDAEKEEGPEAEPPAEEKSPEPETVRKVPEAEPAVEAEAPEEPIEPGIVPETPEPESEAPEEPVPVETEPTPETTEPEAPEEPDPEEPEIPAAEPDVPEQKETQAAEPEVPEEPEDEADEDEDDDEEATFSFEQEAPKPASGEPAKPEKTPGPVEDEPAPETPEAAESAAKPESKPAQPDKAAASEAAAKKMTEQKEKIRKALAIKVEEWQKAGYDTSGLEKYLDNVKEFKEQAKLALKKGKVVKKQYQEQLEAWREKGFDVSELEPLLETDILAFKEKAKDVLKSQK
jgi:hypothetical protein